VPPPPPTITSANQHHLQIAAPPTANDGYIETTRGQLSMIQKGRPSNRSQKLISRQVYMATTKPPPTIEYLNWSGQDI
jgi:hypothetical protein